MKAIKKPDRQLMHIGLSHQQKRSTPFMAWIACLLIDYSTVTDLAKLRGWSTSVPRNTAT